MSEASSSENSRPVFRIDKFKVPPAARFRASGFNPKEFIARLGSEADLANYTRFEPVV